MLSDLQFLPAEVQASIKDILVCGVPPDTVALLVDRILRASEAKTTDLQMSVVRIEEALNTRLDRIGDKLAGDVRTQLGGTNGMLIDIHTSVQNQEAAVLGLRAEFQSVGERLSDIDAWREEVDQERVSFRQSRDESKEQRTRTEAAIHEIAGRLDAFIAHIDQLIAQGPTPEQAEQYRAFLDDLMQRERGAGG